MQNLFKMTNNSTTTNATERGRDINHDFISEYWLYSNIVCNTASFVENILIILTIYKTKTLRTTTNYFVANMAISDVFVPVTEMLGDVLINLAVLRQVLSVALCKVFAYLSNTSYGVSISSLVVITVYRLYAVVLPMRARLQSSKTSVVLILCTWLLPTAVCCPLLYYHT